jgi:hypothetical protein
MSLTINHGRRHLPLVTPHVAVPQNFSQQLNASAPKVEKTSFDLVDLSLPSHATDSKLKAFEELVQVHHTLDQCLHPQNPSSAMPQASLLVLANELLLSIADSLNSERSINAFARTNRRLYLLLNDFLYKHNVTKGESSAL